MLEMCKGFFYVDCFRIVLLKDSNISENSFCTVKQQMKGEKMMKQNQQDTPLYTGLTRFSQQHPISFHVPGHKNGAIFPELAKNTFRDILSIDMTELTGLDDLHAPTGIIAEAEQLAAAFFAADRTFFLVGGSTVGNLAMILAVCSAGERIIVQRNSHKSIINGLELCGAVPVFIAPEYDQTAGRYTQPSLDTLRQALRKYPDAKGIVLTYPDYFGKAYKMEQMIQLAHTYDIPVLVDEAHGVHFSLGNPFPPSAARLGADMVVQSAHKMAPAMTMTAYLHITGKLVAKDRVAHYLQMLQSSSPSYPLMASLDIARSFLATFSQQDKDKVMTSVKQVRACFGQGNAWQLLPATKLDDPLKLTLHIKQGYTGFQVARHFEQSGIYPELATNTQVLFIHGLQPFGELEQLDNAIKHVNDQLKFVEKHATIEVVNQFPQKLDTLAIPYQQMHLHDIVHVSLHQAVDKVAAEAITPYPPGIPLIMMGERVTVEHIKQIKHLIKQGATFQHPDIINSICIFADE